MKLIEPSTEILTWTDPIKHIEHVGRVCYNSYDKIKEGSARPFVDKLIKNGHLSVLEHVNFGFTDRHIISNYFNYYIVKYSQGICEANYRAWYELEKVTLSQIMNQTGLVTNNEMLEQKLPIARVTVKFVTDRAISHQLVRQRPASPMQLSQRYVAHKGDIAFIKPDWYDDARFSGAKGLIKDGYHMDEMIYQAMLRNGLRPEQARCKLPNGVMTEIIITTTLSHWDYIFSLRCDKHADPEMRRLMLPLRDKFEEKGYLI